MELNIVDDTEAKRASAKTRTKTRSKWPALLLLLLSVAFGASGCADSEMWIPQGNSRPGVTREHVQFLDSPPQRPYMVIGIITPPSGEYETVAEAVNAMRKVAARHGADAIYIESQTGSSRGGSGGSLRDISFRAKAIVWSAQREAKARSESEKRQETRTGRSPKIGEAEATSSPSPLTPASAEPMFPTARAVPDKPGYVFSPFDTKGRYIDVSSYPSGSKAKDPWTDKIFIVP